MVTLPTGQFVISDGQDVIVYVEVVNDAFVSVPSVYGGGVIEVLVTGHTVVERTKISVVK